MSKIKYAVLILGLMTASVMTFSADALAQRVQRDGNRVRVDNERVQVDSFTLFGETKVIIQDRWRGTFPANRQDCQSVAYAPVCARTRNYVVSTYSNRCFAEIDGAVAITEENKPCPNVDCHALYLPVCARINRADRDPLTRPEIKAFVNSCMAEKYKGERPDEPEDITTTILRTFDDDIYTIPPRRYTRAPDTSDNFKRVCPTDKSCPDKPDYVCARDANKIARIYRNKCYAVLDGAEYMWHMHARAAPCN